MFVVVHKSESPSFVVAHKADTMEDVVEILHRIGETSIARHDIERQIKRSGVFYSEDNAWIVLPGQYEEI